MEATSQQGQEQCQASQQQQGLVCAHHVFQCLAQAGGVVGHEPLGDIRECFIHDGKVGVTNKSNALQHACRAGGGAGGVGGGWMGGEEVQLLLRPGISEHASGQQNEE